MKMIKGKYEKILRYFENVRDYDYKDGDYFLQENYPNNYLVSLYQIHIINDNKYDYEVEINEITSFNENYLKNIKCSELKKLIKEYNNGN